MFKNILAVDPYRLDNLDTYSNLLYVLELKKDLADLAHKVVNIDKYRVETCCVIGMLVFIIVNLSLRITLFDFMNKAIADTMWLVYIFLN